MYDNIPALEAEPEQTNSLYDDTSGFGEPETKYTPAEIVSTNLQNILTGNLTENEIRKELDGIKQEVEIFDIIQTQGLFHTLIQITKLFDTLIQTTTLTLIQTLKLFNMLTLTEIFLLRKTSYTGEKLRKRP